MKQARCLSSLRGRESLSGSLRSYSSKTFCWKSNSVPRHITIYCYWHRLRRTFLHQSKPGQRVFLFRSYKMPWRALTVATNLTAHFRNSIFTHSGILLVRFLLSAAMSWYHETCLQLLGTEPHFYVRNTSTDLLFCAVFIILRRLSFEWVQYLRWSPARKQHGVQTGVSQAGWREVSNTSIH
jgi:hypothetical protein